MDYLSKGEVLTNSDLDRFVNNIWEKWAFCVHRTLSLAHEKWGQKQKCCISNFIQCKSKRPLISLGSSQLEIPRVHTNQGDSAFSYYAACSWNQLSEETRCAKILATFKFRLKTHLFSFAFVECALCYVRTDCSVLCIMIFSQTVSKIIKNIHLYNYIFF